MVPRSYDLTVIFCYLALNALNHYHTQAKSQLRGESFFAGYNWGRSTANYSNALDLRLCLMRLFFLVSQISLK